MDKSTGWLLLMVVLLLGIGASWGARRLAMPAAVAQVLLGVLLGAAMLGWVPHDARLHALGEAGVVALMGVTGMTVELRALWSVTRPAIGVAVLGIALSLGAGITYGFIAGLANDASVYVGLALAATSIGITAQVFEQYGLMGHRAARIVLAAAIVDDVLALYLLSAAHGFFSGNLPLMGLLGFALVTAAILGLIVVAARTGARAMVRASPPLWLACGVSAVSVGLAAWLTHGLGLSSIVGAFFAGMGIGDGLGITRTVVVDRLRWIVTLLAPAFFIMIGVQAQWLPADGVGLAIVLVVIALLSKTVGGALGAVGITSWKQRWFIGLSMAPRGEVGLIIATMGFEHGHLSQSLFATLVFMVIVVSLIAPVALAGSATGMGHARTAGRSRS